jgi:hypothetical protein
MKIDIKRMGLIGVLLVVLITVIGLVTIQPAYAQQSEGGSVGLEGRINSAPPTTGATISFPRDGATISTLPTTVTGICPTGLLVKLFKNNVFAGSVQCVNGSFSLQIDLFSGRNELVARVYDDLDQAGPDSNIVIVNFPFTGVSAPSRISLTSAFAKRGANPGSTLSWPITISGGTGPYAITVDWGDGKTADVISQPFSGNFDIKHIYDKPGIYNIIIRASDKDGNIAFLQLVGVANGAVGQSNTNATNSAGGAGGGQTTTQTKVLWQPVVFILPFLFASFWLGKRYELFVLRKRLEQREDVS